MMYCRHFLACLLIILSGAAPVSASTLAPVPVGLIHIENEGFEPVLMLQMQEPLIEPLPTVPTAPTFETQRQVEVMGLGNFIRHHNKKLSPMDVHIFASAIHYHAYYYHINPRLVASVIAVESSFRPHAISKTGAIGLGQLKPATADWLGVKNPYDPIENIKGTSKYLGYLFNKFKGDGSKAVSAYFLGPGTVDRQGITGSGYKYLNKVNAYFFSRRY